MLGDSFTLLHRKSSQLKYEEDDPELLPRPWNFFEQSDFALNRSLPVQNFGSSYSFSVRQFDFKDLSSVRLSESCQNDRDCFRYIDQYDPFFVLPYQRGISEAVEVVEAKITKQNPSFEADCQKSNLKGQIEHEETLLNSADSPVISTFAKQELKSPLITRQTQNISDKNEPIKKGFLSKNISKNMGKLLLKFIWKNRQILQSQMNLSHQLWRSFLELIKAWKKQNNITRQFFTSKWKGEGEQYRIFRMVANYFFRKHCLSTILKSNIKQKQLHIEKINKFRKSIVEPELLRSLA